MAAVMGLENIIDVTNDIGAADVILACSSELEENPWIRGVARFHELPVFVIKVFVFYSSCRKCWQDFVFMHAETCSV